MEECEVINRDTLSVIVKKRPQMDTENLLDCYVNLRKEMESYMKYLDAWDKKIAMWGASHQGFTLAATTKLGDKAQYIIDSAPFKHGKFAPSSHRASGVFPGPPGGCHYHHRARLHGGDRGQYQGTVRQGCGSESHAL